MSEQRWSAPTGHTAQTVAQERGRPRYVGARGSHEGPEDQSGPSPSVSPAYASTRPRDQRRGRGRCRACGRTERAHKSLGKPHRTRFPTPPTPMTSFPSQKNQDRNAETSPRADLRKLMWVPRVRERLRPLARPTGFQDEGVTRFRFRGAAKRGREIDTGKCLTRRRADSQRMFCGRGLAR